YEFSGSVSFMILSVTSLLIICLIIAVLARTSFGRSLKAIRDSESAALSLGKNIAVIKTLSVMLSAMLASVAGVLYANYIGFVNVETFTLEDSVLLMAMVIIGGTGTILGPIVGAIVLMALPSLFSYMWFLPESEIG